MRERAEFNKSCNLIGSGSGRNFPIRPALGGRNHKKCFKFAWKPLNDLCYYVNKNLSVKPLSSPSVTSVFITIYSLEIVQFVAILAMITTLKCSRLSHAFRCVVEKNKKVFHQPRSVRIGKNCAFCLEYLRPRAQFFPIRTSRLVINLYLLLLIIITIGLFFPQVIHREIEQCESNVNSLNRLTKAILKDFKTDMASSINATLSNINRRFEKIKASVPHRYADNFYLNSHTKRISLRDSRSFESTILGKNCLELRFGLN